MMNDDKPKPADVRNWKKVLLRDIARMLYPDGDLRMQPRSFSGSADSEAYEMACRELMNEFGRRAN